jgi:hypothetical protein
VTDGSRLYCGVRLQQLINALFGITLGQADARRDEMSDTPP